MSAASRGRVVRAVRRAELLARLRADELDVLPLLGVLLALLIFALLAPVS